MAAIHQRDNGKFQAKVRKAGHNVSKTFETREAALAWAKRFEAGLSQYMHNISGNYRMVEMAPLMGFMPPRVLDAMSKIPYTRQNILEAAMDADKMVGIYFLISKGEIVYVGQSKTDVLYRVAQHKRDGKVFDRYSYMRCKPEQVDDLEALYIDAFLPKNNSSTRAIVPKL